MSTQCQRDSIAERADVQFIGSDVPLLVKERHGTVDMGEPTH
jgi:hypothetical protein